MDRRDLVEFLRQHRYAVQASVSSQGKPQAATVGIAVSDNLEIIFDTLKSTRKYENLKKNPAISFVVGGDGGQTIQYEGIADEPEGSELERIRKIYFSVFPDGKDRLGWPLIVHIRVRPAWIRYSDYRAAEAVIEEITDF